MSVETETRDDAGENRADRAASEFGEAITEMPIYERFAEAKRAVEADEAAQERIQRFEAIREDFMLARQTGQADGMASANSRRPRRSFTSSTSPRASIWPPRANSNSACRNSTKSSPTNSSSTSGEGRRML